LKKKMYLVRRAEPKVHYPVTAATMMAEATRLRAIDGKTVDLHVVNDHGDPEPEQAPESKTRGRKKSLINPVDEEPRTEPVSGHAESSGGQEPPETDHADPGQPDG
jgi:hypothetical protein